MGIKQLHVKTRTSLDITNNRENTESHGNNAYEIYICIINTFLCSVVCIFAISVRHTVLVCGKEHRCAKAKKTRADKRTAAFPTLHS